MELVHGAVPEWARGGGSGDGSGSGSGDGGYGYGYGGYGYGSGSGGQTKQISKIEKAPGECADCGHKGDAISVTRKNENGEISYLLCPACQLLCDEVCLFLMASMVG